MHTSRVVSRIGSLRLALVPLVVLVLLAAASSWAPFDASANHPVLVEGNCPLPTSRTNVTPGTCGDYDGDGLIGTAEDMDGDRVFGTITAALGAASGGANQNGRVTIVTSGIFAEVVNITGANGNVTLEAAPGVEANIDAVLAGDAGSTARQNAPGIIVNAPGDRFITIRNIVSRNWTDGIRVSGSSNVLIDNCRIENNTNFGIVVEDSAKVKINNTQVSATGFRVGGTGDFPRVNDPNPGVGIAFEDDSSGLICGTCVTGSFRAGIKVSTRDNGRGLGNLSVSLQNVCVFNNHPDFEGIREPRGSAR